MPLPAAICSTPTAVGRSRRRAAADGLPERVRRRSAAAAAARPACPRARVRRSTPARPSGARERAALADRPSGERVFIEMRRLLELDDPADGIRCSTIWTARRRAARAGGRPAGSSRAGSTISTCSSTRCRCSTRPPTSRLTPPTTCASSRAGAGRAGRRRWATASPGGGLRLAALFHDVEKPRTSGLRRRPDQLHGPRPPGRRNGRARARAAGRLDRAHPLLPRARAASTCGWASWCASGRSTAGTAYRYLRATDAATRSRAWCCRWPTASPPAASGRASGTIARPR